MKKPVAFPTMLTLLLLAVVIPPPAYAIQAHGELEGLYVHQIGHILFALAMLGFAFRIRLSRLSGDMAWRSMSIAALLLVLWNVWAFSGHILDRLIPAGDFSMDSSGLKSILDLHSPIDVLYYLFKMDHLLSVPALFYVYLALRKQTSQMENSSTRKADR